MGATSLRNEQGKLQRGRKLVRSYEVLSQVSSLPNLLTSSAAYTPPPFLSSSKFIPLLPPAPLAPGPLAPESAHHHEVPTGAIIGGGIATFIALAATAIIVVAIYGKAGFTRLLAPIYCKLLSSCLLGSLLRTGRSARLKSLHNIFRNKKHSTHKRRKSKDADDNDTNEGSSRADSDHRDFLSEILGGGSLSTTASKRESTAPPKHSSTTSAPLEDIVKDQVEQLQTSIHAYIVTTMSDLVESKLEKAKEERRQQQSVHDRVPKTQSCAESLIFSVAETVIDDLRSLNDEIGEAEANAKSGEASKEAVVPMWTQPVDTALSIMEEALKIGADIASASSSTVTQESDFLEEEATLHSKRRGRRLIANPNVEADELGQEEQKQTVLLNDDCIKKGKEYEVQKIAFTELQLLEETASDPASHKLNTIESASAGFPASHKQETSEAASGDTHSLALVPITDTGGIVTNNVAATETMISMPTKEVLSMRRKLRRPARKGKWPRNEVMLKASSKKRKQLGHGIVTNSMAEVGTMMSMPSKVVVPLQKTKRLDTHRKWEGKDAMPKASNGKCKRPSTLGHVSFSCEMSAARLRFFTSCMSGGTFGAPLSSLDHTLTNGHNDHPHHQDIYNHHHDDNTNRIYSSSTDEPNSAHHQSYVPLHNAHQYSLMHQQQYDASKFVLAQHITGSEAPTSVQHIASMPVVAHVDLLESPPKSSNIDDYGGPFDGVL